MTDDVNPFEGVFTTKRLAAFVAHEMGVPVDKVLSPRRYRNLFLARALVAHFAHQRGISYLQISREPDLSTALAIEKLTGGRVAVCDLQRDAARAA